MDWEPVVVVDYSAAQPFEDGAMACTPSAKGLRCRARATYPNGTVYPAYGPKVAESVDGLRALDLDFVAHTGPTSGLAWGIGDGRFTGVLLSNDPKNSGGAWFGAWDGTGWVAYRDWGDPVVKKGWGPHRIHVEFLDGGQVAVSIDGTPFATALPSVPMGGGIAPVVLGVTRTDFVRLSLGGGTVVGEDRPVPPPVAEPMPPPDTPATPALRPLATSTDSGKWEWMLLNDTMPDALFDGWNEVAAEGERLLVRNHQSREDGTDAVILYASGGCGREPFREVSLTPAITAAFDAHRGDRDRDLEREKDPRYAGRHLMFGSDGRSLYAVDGEDLLVSGDDGATWKVAHTIGLSPVPRFGTLVTCNQSLVLVPEVPAVWESMKPEP